MLDDNGEGLLPVPTFISYVRADGMAITRAFYCNVPFVLSLDEAQGILIYVAGVQDGPVTFKWLDQRHTQAEAPFCICDDGARINFPKGKHTISIETPAASYCAVLEVT